MNFSITKLLRIIAVLFSCVSCAAMIWFSNQGNNDAVYTCIILCIVGFFANMLLTAHENVKKVEALRKAQEEKLAKEAEQAQE